MPEPGMGSGGARGGAGMGGGGRQDRDEPGPENLLSGESVGSVLGSDPRSGGKVGGYYSYERGRWVGGTSPKKASPEESFSAKPIAQPIAQPAPTKTTFYLDETPALQPQIDTSAANKSAAAAAERERTMGATMGGGPSYDPLRPNPSIPAWAEEWGQMSEMTASSGPLTFTNKLRQFEKDKLSPKSAFEPVWKPEFSKWSDARKKDWMAGFDKTLGAGGKWLEETRYRMENEVGKAVNQMMEKHASKWFSDSEINGEDYNSVRDVIRHGIMANKYGLALSSGYYETFKSGQELSDYENNYAASKFARTLKPGQNFDDEWAAAVIQEKMNPGSTGITINWSAGTVNDPTAGEAIESWMKSFMNKLKGISGDPNQNTEAPEEPEAFPMGVGMITQAKGGGS